jgi:hypothetical protein
MSRWIRIEFPPKDKEKPIAVLFDDNSIKFYDSYEAFTQDFSPDKAPLGWRLFSVTNRGPFG